MVLDGTKVIGAGLLSLFVTSFLAALVHHLFNIDLISWTLWYLPAGAFIFGWLAAKGLYVAGILLNVRANALFLVVALFFGVAALALTYVFQFWLARDQLPPGMGFADFVGRIVTGEELSVDVVRWNVGLGPIGELGYALAAVRLVAVGAGGWMVYKTLADRPWCARCARFLRTVGSPREFYFLGAEPYRDYRGLTADPVSNANALAEYLALPELDRVDADGVHYVEASLLCCSGCGKQVICERPQAHEGGGWTHLFDDERQIELPEGSDYSSFFPARELLPDEADREA